MRLFRKTLTAVAAALAVTAALATPQAATATTTNYEQKTVKTVACFDGFRGTTYSDVLRRQIGTIPWTKIASTSKATPGICKAAHGRLDLANAYLTDPRCIGGVPYGARWSGTVQAGITEARVDGVKVNVGNGVDVDLTYGWHVLSIVAADSPPTISVQAGHWIVELEDACANPKAALKPHALSPSTVDPPAGGVAGTDIFYNTGVQAFGVYHSWPPTTQTGYELVLGGRRTIANNASGVYVGNITPGWQWCIGYRYKTATGWTTPASNVVDGPTAIGPFGSRQSVEINVTRVQFGSSQWAACV